MIHSTGQAKNGAIASTDNAPAAKAAARLRQPRRLRTRAASPAIDHSAGMAPLIGERDLLSRRSL